MFILETVQPTHFERGDAIAFRNAQDIPAPLRGHRLVVVRVRGSYPHQEIWIENRTGTTKMGPYAGAMFHKR